MIGALLGYIGLTVFLGKKRSQLHNYLLVALFVGVNLYFIYAQPNLAARNLNLAVALLVICFQCMWLVLRQLEPSLRRVALSVGLVFGLYCLVSLIRIGVILVIPPTSNDLFKTGTYDAMVLMAYQMLLILLTFALTLMINLRLLQKISAQEEKFSKAFQSSPYAITLTRPADGKMLEVNSGFERITGYAADEVIGKTTIDLQLWVNDADRVAVVGDLAQGKRVDEKEFQFRVKSGETITGQFSADVIRIGDQPWILSSISDITRLKQIEAELLRLNQELDRRVAARTAQLETANQEQLAFTSAVSHDLRAPMRAMGSFSSILLDQYQDQIDTHGRHYLERIQEASKKADLLINDLLQMAAISRSELVSEEVDLSRLARAIAANLTRREPDRSVQFLIPEKLPAHGDPRLLLIALENLIGNAWKFSQTRQQAIIEVGGVSWEDFQTQYPQGNSSLPAAELGKQVDMIYFVRDNGVGFNMEFAGKLFTPFQRLHGVDEYPGLGSGLAITQRVISRHDGCIWAQSVEDQGAIIFFTLGGK